MNDRELLELASKAAGLELQWCDEWKCMAKWISVIDGFDRDTCWNPLKDDGAALRLAVKLRLDILATADDKVEVHNQWDSEEYFRWAWEFYGDDAMAATRRAIVQTAAAIGKDMP